MNTKEIKDLIQQLDRSELELADTYEANGGEITEDTERREQDIEAMRHLLTYDGVDELGRKLCYFEHRIEDLKAERQHIQACIKSYDNAKEYIKSVAAYALDRLGEEQVKGQNGYSFKRYTSVKNTPDDAAIKEAYLAAAETALREAGIPEWITVKLSGSSEMLAEGDECGASFFKREVKETTKFTHPRRSSEK